MLLQLCYFAALGWTAGDRIREQARSEAVAEMLVSLSIEQLFEVQIERRG